MKPKQILKMAQSMAPKMNKKGGIVSDTIGGVGNMVVLTVIVLIIVSTLLGANLLTGTYKGTADNLSSNFTTGINNVALKIPTILLIVAVVFLFGALVILVAYSKKMSTGGGGSI